MKEHWAKSRVSEGTPAEIVDVPTVAALPPLDLPAGTRLFVTMANGEPRALLEALDPIASLDSLERHGDELRFSGTVRETRRPDLLAIARRALAMQRVKLDEARAAYDATKRELKSVLASKRYQVGLELSVAARGPKNLMRLPGRLAKLRAGETAAPPAPHPRRAQLEAQVDRFLERARRSDAEHVVFMFSGTTFIQPRRANRPIRLTRVLLERGAFVYFSYHGSIDEAETPSTQHERLIETPIDFTASVLTRIAEADLGDKKKTLIVTYPHEVIAYRVNVFNANGWATIYECRDEWEGFHAVGMASWYRPELERYVVNECDRTFCVSWPLRDKMRSLTTTRPVEISPNAYDPGFLADGYTHEPGDEVVIGYFGHLSAAWFDWEGLRDVAKQRPNYRFEIIGHLGPKTVDVPSNVHLLGSKTHAEICEYAKRWRVAIIPFRVGPVADGVDPIKIYEYFALGLPVVSFRMPQIDDYPHTRTVETVDAFVEALDEAVSEPVDKANLETFIANNTWDHRVDQLLGAAEEVLAAPPPEKTLR